MAETIDGGRYLVGGVYVNAEGKPLAKADTGGSERSSTYPSADLLAAGGYKDWSAVKAAKDEDLLALEGIGPVRLAEIRAYRG